MKVVLLQTNSLFCTLWTLRGRHSISFSSKCMNRRCPFPNHGLIFHYISFFWNTPDAKSPSRVFFTESVLIGCCRRHVTCAAEEIVRASSADTFDTVAKRAE